MISIEKFWSLSPEILFSHLKTHTNGLTDTQAIKRLQKQQKQNHIRKAWQRDILLLLSQYKSPLIGLLLLAVVLSLAAGEYSDSLIVIIVLLFTGLLGFFQERNAGRAVEKLQALVHINAQVKRAGIVKQVPIHEIVPGDIVLLSAGNIIPADAYILESNDLHVSESVLTGESYPTEKQVGICSENLSLSQVKNAVFQGTSVISGSATVLIVQTGQQTELGKIVSSLETASEETFFEKGIRRFGYLLMRLTLIICLLLVIVNVGLDKPFMDSLLFALALAVGIAPELLPAIVTITLSAGARRMAARKVIVKKLSAIQNMGAITILCCDKTGTLTEGNVEVNSVVGIDGQYSSKTSIYAHWNAVQESGFCNPIDEALRKLTNTDINSWNTKLYKKTGELPYDFIRKRLSIALIIENQQLLITKGAVDNIVACCSYAEEPDGNKVAIDSVRSSLQRQTEQFCSQGLRIIGVCYKPISFDINVSKEQEKEMIFLGFITFVDPPKQGVVESVRRLKETGIALKLISGDNRLVVKHVATQIGLRCQTILTGSDLHHISSQALERKVEQVDVFAEIEPSQKERIIKALQQGGSTVGYLGDGINDANALKASDVGISTENAVDVAREAADFVLLEKNIDVLCEAIVEGRKTFVNTLKYIFVTTSANFGNMFSVAVSSLVLPFLPLLPTQILLTNFLSDIPSLAIASDKVDAELIAKPRKWDMKIIQRFMYVFGVQSSLFDFLTFYILLAIFHTKPKEFRTGWFIESVISEILILLVIRTRHLFFQSLPSSYLIWASLITCSIVFALPYLPFASAFDLYPLSGKLLAAMVGIAILYIVLTEITKRLFVKSIL
ncbi:magnesium-translocating P-type ATPase [Xanthocytophaga agilis]|uniref:Magnesium-transporting ATPase, P-type 1 n=1 Tax=Xanthocytophaga agilis TaxID=3048010 RepID=A0AAE3R3Q8_9BACT|nr:magnesium-translocating P-type ATPase [Xanthocytophaga agilis]MDJ1500318.1 magnesium-translocating P-type ATPase [Xanthocytophaga agilis]